MDNINNLAFELHDMLLSSNEYKTLKDIEIIMLNDEKASFLINDYQKLLERYNFEKTEEVYNLLVKAKENMNSNEIVIKYKNAYKQYQLLVASITDIVFEDFKSQSIIDKIIRAK